MFDNFEQAIKLRNNEKITSEFTFIGIKESSVEKYEKIKNELFASVKFVSEVISVKKIRTIKLLKAIQIELNLLQIIGSFLEIF